MIRKALVIAALALLLGLWHRAAAEPAEKIKPENRVTFESKDELAATVCAASRVPRP